jgi:hypothetical protein
LARKIKRLGEIISCTDNVSCTRTRCTDFTSDAAMKIMSAPLAHGNLNVMLLNFSSQDLRDQLLCFDSHSLLSHSTQKCNANFSWTSILR